MHLPANLSIRVAGASRVVSGRAAPAIAVRRRIDPDGRLPWRAVVLVLATAVAYHFTLETLATGLSLETPLGYLGIVPVLALLIGASTFVTKPRLRPIHDRQLDWIVGLALLATAAAVDLLPSTFTADFWIRRLDLIGMPFFVAGLLALLYGVRRLWALRWAVLFLFLAWPAPYETALAGAIGASTDTTISIVEGIARTVPIAQSVGGGTFVLSHSGATFAVSVGSACSGLNSVIGFFLLGTAWNAILTGTLPRRLAWLAAGLVVVGALNVARIELIFVAGTLLGAPFAFDVLHPVAGLAVFAAGALLMFALARPFGLEIPVLSGERRSRAARLLRGEADSAALAAGPRIPLAVPAAFALVLGLLFAIPDGALASYSTLVDGFGQPQLAAIDPSAVMLPGWAGSSATTFDQATQYFGPHATWERIAFTPETPAPGPGIAYLDVIRTDDARTLASYGVEACYAFHGYSSVSSQAIDVGAGVEARLASYAGPPGATDWSILWWEWPYDAGTEIRFERLVLLAPVDPNAAAITLVAAGPTAGSPAFTGAEASLASVARSIVAQAMSARATPIQATQP